ncbi:MAG TPA: hypothetical protein VKD08_09805 [Ignavibacteriaceae bacterium]|nr:hypothetical protein [Ignavibacteriaceae bacterium]
MLRIFLTIEAAGFLAASLIHFGFLIQGYEHTKARIPEGIIGLVLLIGVVLTMIYPQKINTISLIAQGFALFGTLVGLFTIILGIGPRTLPDIIFHALIICLLVWGLIIAKS